MAVRRRLDGHGPIPSHSGTRSGGRPADAPWACRAVSIWFAAPVRSPSIFAALLDHDRGGFFRPSPGDPGITCKQLYCPDTALIVTRFMPSDGVGEVLDQVAPSPPGRHPPARDSSPPRTPAGCPRRTPWRPPASLTAWSTATTPRPPGRPARLRRDVQPLHAPPRRRAGPCRTPAARPPHVREDAHLRQPRGPPRRGDRPQRRATGHLPAGVHPPLLITAARTLDEALDRQRD